MSIIIRRQHIDLYQKYMAKEGLNKKTISQLVPAGKTWALCIGAGISFPIFPSWNTLAERIILHSSPNSINIINEINSYFSSEVIIQSCYEQLRSENKDIKFPEILAELLYKDLLKSVNQRDRDLLCKCLSTQVPSPNLDWNRFLTLIKQLSPVSSIDLAQLVIEAYKKDAGLNSIITFNAETLFPTLINAYAQISLKKNDKILDYITEPTTSHYRGRIPFYFCHGLVPLPGSKQKWMNASDKQVFLENEYLQLANNAFSWQAISFYNILSTNTVFFIGLSFRDANVRRWLSWLHKAKVDTINKYGGANESTTHYWIEKSPESSQLKKWYEASVAHLGIRLIWITEWTEVASIIRTSVENLRT